MGAVNCPPDMYRTFAAELQIWSVASQAKFTDMISMIGRTPMNEAPTPIPVKLFSEIGVSMTRFSPYLSYSPCVAL